MKNLETKVNEALLAPKKEINPIEVLKETFSTWKYIIFISTLPMLFMSFAMAAMAGFAIKKLNMMPILQLFQSVLLSEDAQKMTSFIMDHKKELALFFLILLLANCIIRPMQDGVAYVAYQFEYKKKLAMGGLLEGFKGMKYFYLVVFYIVSIICIMISSITIIIPIILMVLLTFVTLLVVVEDASLTQSVSISAKIGKKYFFQIIVVYIIYIILAVVLMMLTTIIPIVSQIVMMFVSAFALLIPYTLYKKIVGFRVQPKVKEESLG